MPSRRSSNKKSKGRQKHTTALVAHDATNLYDPNGECAELEADPAAMQRYLAGGGDPRAQVEIEIDGRPHVVPLLHAIIAHSHADVAKCVQLLTAAGVDVNEVVGTGANARTALNVSVHHDTPAVMIALLQGGADPLKRAVTGVSAIHIAAALDDAEKLGILIASVQGRDLDTVRSDKGETPLMYAAMHGSAAAIARLCDCGVDVTTVDASGSTALQHAAEAGHSAAVALLLRRGARVDIIPHDDVSVVLAAARSGSLPVLQLLLQHGADATRTDSKGMNPLFCAVGLGHVHIVQALAAVQGVSLHSASSKGCTLLMHAALRGQIAAAKLLLAEGLSVTAADRDGVTALHYATDTPQDDTSMLQLLLAHGADIHQRVPRGQDALYKSVLEGKLQCAEVLLRAGADPAYVQKNGMTCLIAAVSTRQAHVQAPMVQLLLQHGAARCINAVAQLASMNGGAVAESCAVTACTDTAALKLLLAAGADVSTVDSAGRSCLHVAVERRYTAAIVCLLLKAPADLCAVDHAGKTPLDLARECGTPLTVTLLERESRHRMSAIKVSSVS